LRVDTRFVADTAVILAEANICVANGLKGARQESRA
jgi:hypothetical protein